MKDATCVCILGRQPALGIAELEGLFGASALTPVGETAVLLAVDPNTVNFKRLGGTVKAGKLLHEFKKTDWNGIEEYLEKHFPEHLKYLPEDGKLNLGLSTYGVDVSVKKQQATALSLKKIAKKHGKAVRVVPNKTHELNSASVLHNNLVGENGWELCFVAHQDSIFMSQTIFIQDIEAYAARDQKRPKRDAKVGMLPPKLAQIIVNLASGKIELLEQQNSFGLDAAQGSQEERTKRISNTVSEQQTPADTVLRQEEKQFVNPVHEQGFPTKVILDPFCGTGVVLQEALLMGYDVFGTDIDLRMVQYSEENIEWLKTRFTAPGEAHVTVGDATNFDWKQAFNIVACETYLGRPFSHQPQTATLKKVIRDVDTIHKKFLENMAKQTEKGTRLCLAVPAWKIKDAFWHIQTLDHLEKLGYTRLSFTHVSNEDLIYHRENQIVGRELVVLVRK